jgi:AraC-like DNA-binding protein
MEDTNSQYDFSKLSEPFQTLIGNKELSFQFYDMFPFPVEIFHADGTTAFINRAFMDWNAMTDANLLVGIYNLINDPVCNDELNGREYIQRAFRGETVFWPDFPVPIKDLVRRSVIDEMPYETACTDLFFYPIWDGDKLAFVVCVFIIKRMYQGKPDVAAAKEYMDNHWREDYDQDALAKALSLSVKQLGRIFKSQTGMTLHDYHKKIKIDKIKEKLLDPNLNVTQAFAECGEDSNGAYYRLFKETVNMTPSEYRDQNMKQK